MALRRVRVVSTGRQTLRKTPRRYRDARLAPSFRGTSPPLLICFYLHHRNSFLLLRSALLLNPSWLGPIRNSPLDRPILCHTTRCRRWFVRVFERYEGPLFVLILVSDTFCLVDQPRSGPPGRPSPSRVFGGDGPVLQPAEEAPPRFFFCGLHPSRGQFLRRAS